MGRNFFGDLFDVAKMQQDELDELLKRTEEENERHRQETKEIQQLIDAADRGQLPAEYDVGCDFTDVDELLAWAKDLQASTEDKYKSARLQTVTYDTLVDMAHKKGYINTSIRDLLTEDEICIADQRVIEIEREFKEKTRLTGADVAFLTIAIALQVVRQYLITPFSERASAKEGSAIMEERYGDGGRLRGKYYYATEDTILRQKKVPFDVVAGSKYYDLGGDGNFSEKTDQEKKGLSGNSHRFRSLGHDPVLGYLFGTANIVTNTATWWNGSSSHIRYKSTAGGVFAPHVCAVADTKKVFQAMDARYKAPNGKKILVEAAIKEHLHLKSDRSTDGLPIPILMTISPELTQKLAEHGVDAIALGGVIKQAAGAELINYLIAVIHGIYCKDDGGLSIARTKKIILISNVIASTSNLIIVGIGAGLGISNGNPDQIKKSLRYLDAGGLIVTIAHLFKDIRFITKLREEYINSKLDALLQEKMDYLDGIIAQYE